MVYWAIEYFVVVYFCKSFLHTELNFIGEVNYSRKANDHNVENYFLAPRCVAHIFPIIIWRLFRSLNMNLLTEQLRKILKQLMRPLDIPIIFKNDKGSTYLSMILLFFLLLQEELRLKNFSMCRILNSFPPLEKQTNDWFIIKYQIDSCNLKLILFGEVLNLAPNPIYHLLSTRVRIIRIVYLGIKCLVLLRLNSEE